MKAKHIATQSFRICKLLIVSAYWPFEGQQDMSESERKEQPLRTETKVSTDARNVVRW